jgi:hypothetical protein
VLEDGALDPTELAAGFQAELVAQDRPGAAVGSEGLGLPAAPVEGDHQVGPEPLPEGMLPHERLEFTDELSGAAGGEVGADAGFEGGQVLLAEAHRLRGQAGVWGDAGQGFTSPLRDGPAQVVAGPINGSGPEGVLTGADERSEAANIDGVGVDSEEVAGRLGDDDVGAQGAAEIRHVRL